MGAHGVEQCANVLQIATQYLEVILGTRWVGHAHAHDRHAGVARFDREGEPADARVPADKGVVAAPGRSEEHTSELQSLMRISYAVFCLKKKNTHHNKQ